MANTNAPRGLTPVMLNGGGNVGRSNEYNIASGLGSDIFTGDIVKSTGTNKEIDLAAAGETVIGVFAGVQYKGSDGSIIFKRNWETGTVATEAKAFVYDDPNILFEVQADEDIVADDIGALTDLVNNGSGTPLTGQSTFELDSSQVGVDAQVKIVELVRKEDNEFGTNAKVLVLLNEHEYRAGSLTGI